MTELRKLQTERQTRFLMIPGGVASPELGITDTRKAVRTATLRIRKAAENSSFCKPAQATSSFCKPRATPRNAQCPRGCGAKYKRCCGKPDID